MIDYEKELIDEINVAAYFISEENHPYDTLCWFLAERQLSYRNQGSNPPEDIIKQKAAQIFFEKCPYEILVWRIAELDILIKYNRYGIKDIEKNQC